MPQQVARCSPARLRRLFVALVASSAVFSLLVTTLGGPGNLGSRVLLGDLGDVDVEKNATEPPLLCIFTTFKPVNTKTCIYENVLRNWALLAPEVRPVLFVTPNDTNNYTEFATSLGWAVHPAPRLSVYGVPYLKEMFTEIVTLFDDCFFYGYANGDILFNAGLIRTLESITEVLDELKRTMVIGRRSNFQIRNREVYLLEDVTRIGLQEGKLFITNAEDYFFIAHNDYPWNKVPDIVIGRPAYDNFLVTAIRSGVSVVDATLSLPALHQSDVEGDYAGHNNTDWNFNVLAIGKKFRYRWAHTVHSQYLTYTSRKNVRRWTGVQMTGSGGGRRAGRREMKDDSGEVLGKVTVHKRYRRQRVYPSSSWSRIRLW